LAATLGDGVVRSTDGLVAYLWQDDGEQLFAVEAQGSSGAALVAALVRDGVRVPALPIPEPDRTPWGEEISVPEDRVAEIEARVEELHPRPGTFTCFAGKDWIVAKSDIDLRSIVDEVLAIPRSEPPPA